MALSARRKHLINRIAALIKNLEKAPENFTLDKSLDRMAIKLEARLKHETARSNYKQAVRDRQADLLMAKAEQNKEEAKRSEAQAAANAAEEAAAVLVNPDAPVNEEG